MANLWMKVSAEEAQKHPLYGRGGWLIVFWIGSAIGAVSAIAYSSLFFSSSVWNLLPLVSFSFVLVAAAPIIVLMLGIFKSPRFRTVSTIIVAAIIPIAFLLMVAGVGSSGVFYGLEASDFSRQWPLQFIGSIWLCCINPLPSPCSAP